MTDKDEDESDDLRRVAARLAVKAAANQALAATREGMMDVLVEMVKRAEADRDRTRALLDAYDGLVLRSSEE